MIRTIALVAALTMSAAAQSPQKPASVPAQTAPAQPVQATPAPAPKPCTGEEAHQLDFWVGTWELTWPNPQSGAALHGTNNVTRELDGCVIAEHFSGGDAIPLRGLSYSIFNPRLGKWQQTWVDNQGGYIDLTGDFRDGQMVLQREIVLGNGSRLMQRMIYKNIKPDSFDWSWERSTDGGQTWQVAWPIHYTRK